MKKRNLIFSMLCLLTLLITSCSSDDLTIEQKTLSKSEQDAIVKLVSTNLSIAKNAQVSIESVKLKKIEDSYYLLSYHGDEITTTLLRIENETILKYAGISCTSKNSAKVEGCLPDTIEKRCIQFSSDLSCTKTVTSDVFSE